jgi:hypothetical protein
MASQWKLCGKITTIATPDAQSVMKTIENSTRNSEQELLYQEN